MSRALTIAALLFAIAVNAFAGSKPHLKPLPAKSLAMSCTIDQYRVARNGAHIPTYMRCEDQQGSFTFWMVVPDHAMSSPRDPGASYSASSAEAAKTEAPPQASTAKPTLPTDDDYDDDPDTSGEPR